MGFINLGPCGVGADSIPTRANTGPYGSVNYYGVRGSDPGREKSKFTL